MGPWLAGLAFDANGSYTVPFIGLMMVGFAGAASAAASAPASIGSPSAVPVPCASTHATCVGAVGPSATTSSGAKRKLTPIYSPPKTEFRKLGFALFPR